MPIAAAGEVSTPKTTVILIAHNHVVELRRSIAALERSENRESIEILLVDCGSTDSTTGLVEEFPGMTMQRLPQNFGATKALNIASMGLCVPRSRERNSSLERLLLDQQRTKVGIGAELKRSV